MDDDQSMEEILCDFGQAKDRSIQKHFETSKENCVLVQFKVRSEERIATLANTNTRNRSPQNTACVLFWDSGMHENSEELYHEVFQSPRVPRITLKPNSQNGREDQPDQEPRESSDHHCASGSCGVTHKQQHRPQNTEHSSFYSPTTETRIAEKQSNSWFSSSRITRTRILSYWVWNRPKRKMRSARNRRSLTPTWATRRTSSFAKPLPRQNAPNCALYWQIGTV